MLKEKRLVVHTEGEKVILTSVSSPGCKRDWPADTITDDSSPISPVVVNERYDWMLLLAGDY